LIRKGTSLEGVGLQELYLNNNSQKHPTLYDCLVSGEAAQFPSLIQKPPTESFSVIPASYEMMLAE
jgi:hypothetical protein